jgi:hypothetical protein
MIARVPPSALSDLYPGLRLASETLPADSPGWRVDTDHCASDADPGILRVTRRSRARDHIPLAVRHTGAGWSWPHRYGGASRVRKSIVPPGCWAHRTGCGPGASALREGGRTGSPDECTIRAFGPAVTGSGGICRPDPVCAFCDGVPTAEAPQGAIPDTAVAAGLLRPAENATAASAGGLRGNDRGGRDPVPAPMVPFAGQGDRNYAVTSSPAPARSTRISPMVGSRLSVSGSGR